MNRDYLTIHYKQGGHEVDFLSYKDQYYKIDKHPEISGDFKFHDVGDNWGLCTLTVWAEKQFQVLEKDDKLIFQAGGSVIIDKVAPISREEYYEIYNKKFIGLIK